MNRQGKKEVIDELKNSLASSTGSFLVNCKGLTVADMQTLRTKLREHGGHMQVAKTRLMRLAVQDIQDVEGLDAYLKDQLAFVFTQDQPSNVAKVLYDVAKKNQNLTVIAGYVEKKCLDAEGIKFVASLPSREVLLGQLAAVLSAPTTQFARLLNGLLVKLVLTLKCVEEKKQ